MHHSKLDRPTSGLGHEGRFGALRRMSAYHPIATDRGMAASDVTGNTPPT